MESIPLQVTIGGMGSAGQAGAETILGEFEPITGVLMIHKSIQVPPGSPEVRRGEAAVLTNNTSADDRDGLFNEDNIRDAIIDFFNLDGRGQLVLLDDVARHNPKNKIEQDGMDERGRKFRFGLDITNAQIAVVAMCWFAMKQGAVHAQLEVFDEFQDMAITTVGMDRHDGRPRHIAGYAMGGQIALGYDGWPV